EPAPVTVGRRAARRRPEAVDGAAVVAQAAEDLLRLVVEPLRPVDVELELGELAGPVRDVDTPRTLRLPPRVDAAVGQLALPALQRPVRAVGCLAGGDDECERGAVVGAASIPEPLPVGRVAVFPPAARVVPLEVDLRHVLDR